MGVHDDDATATLMGMLERAEDDNGRLRAEVERLREAAREALGLLEDLGHDRAERASAKLRAALRGEE